nr:uncharacterized mitochondrial protein AtMg00810-like [Tanacetum cinerariifolium]
YQANPKESHLVAIKRIFRYLKGTPNLGLWYPNGSSFNLKAYFDSEYAGCNLDRKSTSGGYQILRGKGEGLLLRLRISRELVVEMVRDRMELVVKVGGKNGIKMNSVSNGVTGMKGFMGCTGSVLEVLRCIAC